MTSFLLSMKLKIATALSACIQLDSTCTMHNLEATGWGWDFVKRRDQHFPKLDYTCHIRCVKIVLNSQSHNRSARLGTAA